MTDRKTLKERLAFLRREAQHRREHIERLKAELYTINSDILETEHMLRQDGDDDDLIH